MPRLKSIMYVVLCALTLAYIPCSTAAVEDAPGPAYFYIEFHTEAIIGNKVDFDIETELLRRLAAILEKHRARGSFMLLDIYPRMIRAYNAGTVNIVRELEKRGHEIGVHFHSWGPKAITVASTIRDVKSSGVSHVESLTTSFSRDFPEVAGRRPAGPAYRHSRLHSMLDDTYAGGITSAFRWCMPDATPVRIARDAWITSSGTNCGQEQPRPDLHTPILAVGQYRDAGYTFTERDDSFKDILARLRRAFPRFRSGRINYFPVAIHDYYFLNPSGTPTANRIVAINEERLRSFDAFLERIDGYVSRGDLQYATRRDVTRACTSWEQADQQDKALPTHDARLRVFYLVHVHSAAAERPEFAPLTVEEFNGTVRAVDAIARTLEAHGAVGDFHVMQNFAEAAVRFQGAKDNILTNLKRRGHDIGAHVHTDRFDQWEKTRNAILSAGIETVSEISGLKRTALSARDAFARAADLGYRIILGNNSPLDPLPMEAFRTAAVWGFPGNGDYRRTGTFIMPWFPDYARDALTRNDPAGQVLYLDSVSPNLWTSVGSSRQAPDAGGRALRQPDFDVLEHYVRAAIDARDRTRYRSWGFITHEEEYQTGGRGFHPTNAIDPEAIRALDDFLSELDNNQDAVLWATPETIYRELNDERKTEHH
jgi:hypothetical protein